MTYDTWTGTEILWAGPPASYTAGGSSSTAAFALTAGSSGNYQQPLIRGLLLQQGRNNQVVTVEGWLEVSAEGSATTLTVTVALSTSANQSSGSTLLAFPAFTVTSYSTGGIWFKTTTICRGVGYGTSATSTNLETSAQYLGTGNSTTIQGVVNMTQLNNIDFSLNQWVTVIGQFSTNNASNSAQLMQAILRGEN